jgi:BCD family chlorophyll transporter-like MFS transporter
MTDTETPINTPVLPRINIFTMLRMGLFQLGLGMMSVLTLGLINRVMIDELNILPWITAGAIAMHQMVAPARVWFGQMSDSKTFLGFHRTSFVWLGAILFALSAWLAVQVMWQVGLSVQANGWGLSTYLWSGLLALIFAGYGLALSASSTPFAALLVDVSDDDNRSQLIGVVWSMLMVGIVVGAIIISRLIERPEVCGADLVNKVVPQSTEIANIAQLQATINPVFVIVPAIVFSLCCLATFGIENKYSRYKTRSSMVNREDQITLKTALKVLTANRQTGIFFSFLLVLTISLFMQDAVMEPYGGQVFGMCISETTKLNAFFGSGTLFGIASTGFLILPRLGKQKTVKLGCSMAAICLIIILAAGFVANPSLLKSGLLLFGLSSGVLTAGATSLMLDLTAAETAGTFIGAWGLSQAIARGLATIFGGTVLNIGKLIFSAPVYAYGLVFVLQAIGLMTAIVLLNRVNIREFQDNTKRAIATIISGDLD